MTPSGRHILTNCEDSKVRYWDLLKSTSQPFLLPDHPTKVVLTCISSNGRYVATASLDYTIRLFDLDAPDAIKQYIVGTHPKLITSMCMNDDGSSLVTGSRDNTAKIWNLKKPDSPSSYALSNHSGPVTTTILTARYAITGSNNCLKVWKLKDLSQPPRELEGHTRLISSAKATPVGSRIITFSKADKTAKFWEINKESISSYDLKDTNALKSASHENKHEISWRFPRFPSDARRI